jgi:hypothetical protein
MNTPYCYVIIKNNFPELERESVLLENKYKKTRKYAYICKTVYQDGSEGITFIRYSNDLEKLQNDAADYVSWYNYPLNLTKNIKGYITHIDK